MTAELGRLGLMPSTWRGWLALIVIVALGAALVDLAAILVASWAGWD